MVVCVVYRHPIEPSCETRYHGNLTPVKATGGQAHLLPKGLPTEAIQIRFGFYGNIEAILQVLHDNEKPTSH